MAEEVNVSIPKGETGDTLSDTEIRQFYFQKYFSSNPETAEEKDITTEELPKIIKSYYNKCHEQAKNFVEGSEAVQMARKKTNWSGILKTNFAPEDVTYVAETLLLEYEMSADEELPDPKVEGPKVEGPEGKDTVMTDEKESSGEKKNVDASEDVENPSSASVVKVESRSRKHEECAETLVSLYYHADVIEKSILQNWKELTTPDKVDSKDKMKKVEGSKELEENLEAASLSEKVASPTTSAQKISPSRLEFIRSFKVMIRASLMLFKRMNPEWVKQAAKVFEKTSFSENPPSVSSSSSEGQTKTEISEKSGTGSTEMDTTE